MSIIKNNFFEQISLATIKKKAKILPPNKTLEFWETEIIFKHNKSDFKFNVISPEKNSITNKVIEEWKVGDTEIRYKTNIEFEKSLMRRGNVKRFLSQEEAELYLTFNLMQLYKPLKNYIDDNNTIDKFNNLIEKHPELFVKELGNGKSWLAN